MTPYDDEPTKDYPHHSEQTDNAPATAYKVEDDDNLKEKDLKRSYLFGDSEDKNPDQHNYESHGMGGQNFGENNVTRSGDDPANKSRNAGYHNDYFQRTEPLEEHPENNNFKPTAQEGSPDPAEGTGEDIGYREAPDQEKVGGGEPEVEGDHSASGDAGQYQTGTADNDGSSNPNVEGDLQTQGSGSVTEDTRPEPGKANYRPEDQSGPDYGSNSPDSEGSKVTEGE